MKTYISSESVTCGHPDKICDQISDAILDACLEKDPNSRVACECMITTGTLIISWEITTQAKINYTKLARDIISNKIGYNSTDRTGFSGDDCGVHLLINTQSPDIAMGVDTGGAGDQGIMFGYASDENDAFMPMPIYLAHRLAERLEYVRKENILTYLLPDAKSQVTIEYNETGMIRVDTIVISNQHIEDISQELLKEWIQKEVIEPIVGKLIDSNTIIHINPTGKFHIWWPKGDCGLTWRKIIVDTYGGIGRHGWGAFSGKDPSKVDRSAAYIARYLAKNIVASWICSKCEIQLGYAIWVAQPVSIYLDCFGTEKVSVEFIIDTIKNNFDLSPKWIIEKLDLKKPQYLKTATYGHFGRDDVSWEMLDSVNLFKKSI